jgi:hypothetical protein
MIQYSILLPRIALQCAFIHWLMWGMIPMAASQSMPAITSILSSSGMALVVSLPQTEYFVGQPIQALVVLSNATEASLDCSKHYYNGGAEIGFGKIRIIDQSTGWLVPQIFTRQDVFNSMSSSIWGGGLGPHKVEQMEVELTARFALSKAGKYYVSAGTTQPPDNYQYRETPGLEISLTNAPEQTLTNPLNTLPASLFDWNPLLISKVRFVQKYYDKEGQPTVFLKAPGVYAATPEQLFSTNSKPDKPRFSGSAMNSAPVSVLNSPPANTGPANPVPERTFRDRISVFGMTLTVLLAGAAFLCLLQKLRKG